MIARQRRRFGVGLALGLLVIGPGAAAQRGGGGGSRGGGGISSSAAGPLQPSRLETLESAFKLTKDQKKSVKAMLDEAHKSAAPLRDRLSSARTAIATAVQGGKSQAEIDAATAAYGREAAAMATLEMKTLARIMQAVEPDQRANTSAIRSAFFLMRGIFLDNKKWDAVPDLRDY